MCNNRCSPLDPTQGQKTPCCLSADQDVGHLESLKIVSFPSTRFFYFPALNILLIDESDTLYQWDGNFAHYVSSTDGKYFSGSRMIMMLDPFYNPSIQDIQLPDRRTEKLPLLQPVKQFSANLCDRIKKHENLDEVVLLSSDQRGFEFAVHVKQCVQRFAFSTIEDLMRFGKGIDNNAAVDPGEEGNHCESTLPHGWNCQAPRIRF